MQKDNIVICRPFSCPLCEQLHRPITEYYFVVYGHEHQTFFVNKAKYHGVNGITPHIIMYDGKQDDTHKEILVVCGIVGCGINIYESNDPEYPYDIELKKVRVYKITHADYQALIDYRDNDYKIN